MDVQKLDVVLCDKKDYIDLKHIWKVCFGDSDEYIDFFFENKISNCYPIAFVYDAKIIGAMYLMPVSAMQYCHIKKGLYGYAIGVLPEYRKNGVYSFVHSKIEEYVISNNMFYIISPANQKLCDYYKGLGLIENAYVCEKTYEVTADCTCSFLESELDFKKYHSLRNEYLKDKNAVFWDEDALCYVLKENEFTGGFNIILTDTTGMQYFVIIKKTQDMIVVTESNTDNPEKLNGYLSKRFNCKKIKWVLPSDDTNQKILYGLTCNLKKDNYYLNLILN